MQPFIFPIGKIAEHTCTTCTTKKESIYVDEKEEEGEKIKLMLQALHKLRKQLVC